MSGRRPDVLPVDRQRIFAFWLGGHPLTPRRAAQADALRKVGLDLVLIDDATAADWEVAGHPFHPAFRLLSPIHRADYLRCYLMHHHGGAYADLKLFEGSWLPAMAAFDDPSVWANGYPEYRWGVASFGVPATPRYQPWRVRWWRYRYLQLRYRSLIGIAGFAFRPGTPLTRAWLTEVEARLTRLQPALERNPGRYAKERAGDVNDGVVSHYPVPWSSLLADVLHPLLYRYRHHVRQDIPRPPETGHHDPVPAGSSGQRDLTRIDADEEGLDHPSG